MRLALLDPVVTLSLDVRRLADVFRARRAKLPFAASAPPLDVARAMFVSVVDDALGADLDDIERFGHDRGARALLEAGRACKRDLSRWPTHEPPPSLAARLVAARTDSPELLRVFRRARIREGRSLALVPSFELVAKTPRAPLPLEACRARVRAGLKALFRPDFVDVFVAQDDDTNELHAAALILAPARTLVTVDARGRIAAQTSRPFVSLHVTYDPATARLRVKTESPERLFDIAKAFGEALFDDGAYFSDRPSLTLKPLQQVGIASIERAVLPGGVSRARIVALLYDTLLDARVESRGDTSWDAIEARTGLQGGYFTQATLRLDLPGEELPVDVFVKLPYRLDVGEKRYLGLARRIVKALGWMDPGALADDAWTLAPFVHPEWRWIEVLGGEAFRLLVEAGLLVKRRGPRVAGAAFRRLGASYVTFEVPGERGVRYALSEDLSAPARDVREEDLEVWELDTAALAAKMRAELSATAATDEVPGVVDIGHVRLGGAKLRVFYAMRAVDRHLARRIAAACAKRGETPVLLVPAGRRASDALCHVELSIAEQLGAARLGPVLGRIVQTLEIEDAEPWMQSLARLVVERSTRRVWIDGVAINLAEWSYRMLECLVEKAGTLVPSKELAAHIVGPRGRTDDVMKKARPDLLRRVEKSFTAAGVTPPADVLANLVVVEGKRGYRLMLSAQII